MSSDPKPLYPERPLSEEERLWLEEMQDTYYLGRGEPLPERRKPRAK